MHGIKIILVKYWKSKILGFKDAGYSDVEIACHIGRWNAENNRIFFNPDEHGSKQRIRRPKINLKAKEIVPEAQLQAWNVILGS